MQNSTFDSATQRLFHRSMNDSQSEIPFPKLLREHQAARLLRRSPAVVQRLRLERKLGYIRGRPVTIMQKDLEIYVAWAKRRRVLRKGTLNARRKNQVKGESLTFEYVSAGATPKPFNLLTIAEAAVRFDRKPRHIRHLCFQGRIPYILGRPPLIDEQDLAEHFETKRLAGLAKLPPAMGTPEFDALQRKKMFHRLRVKALKRKMMDIRSKRVAP
jgi:hypothetical protein